MDPSCRSHGGCPWCLGNHEHGTNKRVLAAKDSRVQRLLDGCQDNATVVEELFLATLAREPTPEEKAMAVSFLDREAAGATAAVLHTQLLPKWLFAWTSLADPALLAFFVGGGLVLASQLMSPTATGRSSSSTRATWLKGTGFPEAPGRSDMRCE